MLISKSMLDGEDYRLQRQNIWLLLMITRYYTFLALISAGQILSLLDVTRQLTFDTSFLFVYNI